MIEKILNEKAGKLSKCLLIGVAVLLGVCLPSLGEGEETAVKTDDKAVWSFNPEKLPENYPLVLTNQEVGRVKDLLDNERRTLKAVFENRLGKDVVLQKVLCGCPCLTLAKEYAKTTVAANGRLELDFSIDGHAIHDEKFKRWMLFQVEGLPEVFLNFEGNLITKMRYEPVRSMNLGTFVGNVDWTRTIKIISDFQEDITLEPPADHPLLKAELKKTDAKTYELTIKPKSLPMKSGRFFAKFALPVKGVEHYGPVVVGVRGEVKGLKLALSRQQFTMDRAKMKAGEKGELKTLVILEEDKKSRIHFNSRRRETVKDKDAYFPVSNEEEAVRPLDKLETWEKIAQDIQVKLPEGVKLTKTAAERQVVLNIEIAPDYLEKAQKAYLQLPVTYHQRGVGNIQIGWR